MSVSLKEANEALVSFEIMIKVKKSRRIFGFTVSKIILSF
jgi:hypothetical protein